MWRKDEKSSNPYQRWGIAGPRRATMFWALLMWVCALPVLALLAIPFLGWTVTAYLAGLFLVADVVVCWVICRSRMPGDPGANVKGK